MGGRWVSVAVRESVNAEWGLDCRCGAMGSGDSTPPPPTPRSIDSQTPGAVGAGAGPAHSGQHRDRGRLPDADGDQLGRAVLPPGPPHL